MFFAVDDRSFSSCDCWICSIPLWCIVSTCTTYDPAIGAPSRCQMRAASPLQK